MTTERPRTPKMYVTVVNPITGKSKSITVYHPGSEEPSFITDLLRRAIEGPKARKIPESLAPAGR